MGGKCVFIVVMDMTDGTDGQQSSKVRFLYFTCKYYANFCPKMPCDSPRAPEFLILSGLKCVFGLNFSNFGHFWKTVRKIENCLLGANFASRGQILPFYACLSKFCVIFVSRFNQAVK